MKALASAEKEKKEKELQHQALSLTPIEQANTDVPSTAESIGNTDQSATNNAAHGQSVIIAGNAKSEPSVSAGNSSQKAAANIFIAGKTTKILFINDYLGIIRDHFWFIYLASFADLSRS